MGVIQHAVEAKPVRLLLMAMAAILPYTAMVLSETLLLAQEYAKVSSPESGTSMSNSEKHPLIGFMTAGVNADSLTKWFGFLSTSEPSNAALYNIFLVSQAALALIGCMPLITLLSKFVTPPMESERELLASADLLEPETDKKTDKPADKFLFGQIFPITYLYYLPVIAAYAETFNSLALLLTSILIQANPESTLSVATSQGQALGLVGKLSSVGPTGYYGVDAFLNNFIVGIFHCLILLPIHFIVNLLFPFGSRKSKNALSFFLNVGSPYAAWISSGVQRLAVSLAIVTLLAAQIRMSTLRAKSGINSGASNISLSPANFGQTMVQSEKKSSRRRARPGAPGQPPVAGLSKIQNISEKTYKN